MTQMKRCETMLPVMDIERAKHFYRDTLGLEEAGEVAGNVAFKAGDGASLELVPHEGPTRADHTVCGFEVDDVESAVRELEQKGVEFEEYDLPDLKTENKVATIDGARVAWFKDTEGNILCVHDTATR